MIFLTNKPISTFKDVSCKLTGIAFSEVDSIELPSQIVVDVSNDCPTRSLQQIVRKFNCKYIEAPVELVSGNTIFVVQDAMQNIVKIEAL